MRKPPPRRRHSRRPLRRGSRMSLRTRAILIGSGLVVVLLAWAIFARAFAPTGNTARTRFDAIIVLGSPTDSEGNPTPTLLARVTEGVHEYERGVAPRLILSGFVEAPVMARTAEAQGVPASSIFQEPNAADTIQNACYASRIMKAHGWRSAEVVSAASHLPRAGLIFSHTSLEWRAHAAPPLEADTGFSDQAAASVEILKTLRYLVYAQWADKCE